MSAKKVLVAMSGGIDSSVTALLLQKQGYDVIGVHLKLWDFAGKDSDLCNDGLCCSLDSIIDCRIICDKIDVPFYVLNMTEQFRESIIEYFVSEYKSGRTPNPCIKCNRDIKWAAILNKARELECDFIATGHYAFNEKNEDGRCQIRRGIDKTRDQSYVLWDISQQALAKTLMPLGGLTKTDVRRIAAENELKNANSSESRDICFIPDNNYHRFLKEWCEKKNESFTTGDIVHENGTVLGQHEGTAFYTIGQRRGLGIAHPTPLYVLRIEPDTNRVIVGDDDMLYRDELEAENVNWVAIDGSELPLKAQVKIRYRHSPADAEIVGLTNNRIRILFDEKQRAITPGQSVVFYDNDVLLGGGIIV
ncbi:MAG: tRNA 2-thiouridine(34) synthase MnmA [candidate division Zixibacteria bacterium]|nr:tRNA 2-thiouridine(34) synthase MnmA [candidate division Zixibacteria bacterium]